MSMLSDDTLLVEHKMMNSCRVWPADSEKWQSEYRAWVKSDDHSHAETQLKRWLDGLDLPAQSLDTQPYLTLLRALPRGDERTNSSLRMAKLASLLLSEFCASLSVTPSANGVLYNLLCLCAGLAQPDVLAGPLDDLLTCRDLRDASFTGYDLSASLRLALVWNQSDDRWLRRVWRPMLLGDPTCPVHGDWVDAVDGFLKLAPQQVYPLGRTLQILEPSVSVSLAEWEGYYKGIEFLIEKKIDDCTLDTVFIGMQEAGCSEMALRSVNLRVEDLIASAYEATAEEVMEWTLLSCRGIKKGLGSRSTGFLKDACITHANNAWIRKHGPATPRNVLQLGELLGLPVRLTRS